MNEGVGARLGMAWTEEPPGSLPLLDRVLMMGSDELDRLCAYVLRHLRERAEAAVLDVVGVLGPERLLAIYVNLPRRQQAAVLRDPVWAYHVGRADLDAIETASQFWDEIPDLSVPDDMPWPEQREYFAFIREADRYRAGLSHELTPEQVEMVSRGHRKSREILANARQEQSP